eukprot:TRINITY_DN5395_c0_g1_i1.p1 TRINITY_DN5395_c0_g1~~TRINITY_DN5395_c0_g1_i1.p1  ORF type:complete len:359 (+),score=68.45 TRINITY_DN5395_c0_g1_i1:1029-2105(+)
MVSMVSPACCVQNTFSPALVNAAASSSLSSTCSALIAKVIAPGLSKLVASTARSSMAFSKDHLPLSSSSLSSSFAFLVPMGSVSAPYYHGFSANASGTAPQYRHKDWKSALGVSEFFQEQSIRKQLEKIMLETRSCLGAERDGKPLDHFSLHLNISNFSMTPAELKALGGFIASNDLLGVITFDGLPFSAEDMRILMNAYVRESPREPKLQSIVFYDNRLGDDPECFSVLVQWIKMIPSVEHVSIIRNSISDEHLHHVAGLVTDHKKLRRLSLSWNCIKDATVLVDALVCLGVYDRYSSLAEMDLSFNLLDDAQVSRLKEAAPKLNHKSYSAKEGIAVVFVNLVGNRPLPAIASVYSY